MSFSGNLVEQARSLEFFTNPNSYGPFFLNRRNQRTIGCIDPRDEKRDNLSIIVQTGGGAAGPAYDQAMAVSAKSRNGFNFYDAIAYDSLIRKVTVAAGHTGCAFMQALEDVNNEIANPSAMTEDTLGRLVARYDLSARTSFESDMKEIQDTAKRNQDVVANIEPTRILRAIDAAYPTHKNIGEMVGENAAGIYIFGHHPFVGLDRRKVHREKEPLKVQAYHSSTCASYEGLLGLNLPREIKNLRLAAFIMREAAVPTILIKDPRIAILHVVPNENAPNGLQIERQYRDGA